MVQPTTFFGFRSYMSNISGVRCLNETTANTRIESVNAVDGCSKFIDPTCLANLYSFKSAKNYSTELLGVAGFLEEYAIPSDLEKFLSKYAVEGNETHTFNCVKVNASSCPMSASQAGHEANLDVQYARAISASVPINYYSTAGRGESLGHWPNTNEPFIEFLEYLLGLDSAALPNTLSISYGDAEKTVPDTYATPRVRPLQPARRPRRLHPGRKRGQRRRRNGRIGRVHRPRGQAVLHDIPGVVPMGHHRGRHDEDGAHGRLGRLWRGALLPFPQPSYQATAVSSWLASGTADSVFKYFNASGLAYPDVAAQAANYLIISSGGRLSVHGTSAAAPAPRPPAFASIIQLVNSDRRANGKAGLDFLNPWLYANATSALTDIKTGRINGCNDQIFGAGFEAVPGWDPTTGLGTPNFTSLLSLSNKT